MLPRRKRKKRSSLHKTSNDFVRVQETYAHLVLRDPETSWRDSSVDEERISVWASGDAAATICATSDHVYLEDDMRQKNPNANVWMELTKVSGCYKQAFL